ncbi:MAG TPA: hypothetical protein VG944_11605 [Fimbriimonas sp.]|nr:hypothetical protein [Fimbriimonas sp.]
MRRWLPLVFLALLPLLPLWRAVFLGEAIGPFDQIRQMAPWNGPKPAQPWDVLQADGVLQFYPWRDMVFDSWGKGQLPLWNPYELAGTPLMANSQSAAFYPPHILLGILHMPTALAITLLAWFHLAWAAFGVYYLSRRLEASTVGAMVAGASFGLSPFMLGWTALASVIETVSWIPWILGAIAAIFTEGPLGQSKSGGPGLAGILSARERGEEPTSEQWADFVRCHAKEIKKRTALSGSLAICIGMLLLAGHLQFAAYGLMAAVVFSIGLLLTGKPVQISSIRMEGSEQIGNERVLSPFKSFLRSPQARSFSRCLLLFVLGGLLSSVQLLPVLSYSRTSHRQNTPTAEGYGHYVDSSLKPFELANLAEADALGYPRTPIDAGGTTISEYWPLLVKQGDNFAESAVTIGPFILALLFLTPWKRRELWPLAAVGLLALLLALGTALNMALYYLVPGWSASGSPGRVVVLFVLAASVLAAFGIPDDAPKPKFWPLLGIVLGLLLAFAGPSLAPAANGLEQLQGAATSAMLPKLAITTGLALAGLALVCLPALAKYRSAAIAIPVLICAAGYGSDLIMTGRPLEPIRGVAQNERVAFLNDSWGIGTAVHAVAPPNTGSLSRIHEIGGYDSLLNRDTVGLLKAIDRQDPAPPVNGNMMFVKRSADEAALSDAGVTLKSQGDGFQPLSELKGRFTLTDGAVKVADEGYEHLTLTADGFGTLTVRDRMMPGWECQVDGKPTPIPDGMWRVVQILNAGSHRIEFRYRPPGLSLGLALTAAALVILILIWVSGFRVRSEVKPSAV